MPHACLLLLSSNVVSDNLLLEACRESLRRRLLFFEASPQSLACAECSVHELQTPLSPPNPVLMR